MHTSTQKWASVRARAIGLILPFSLLLLSPARAHACGICAWGIVAWFIPAVVEISAGAVIWFIGMAIVFWRAGREHVGIPSPTGCIVLVFVALVLSVVFLGPMTLLPFTIPCSIVFLRSLRVSWSFSWDPALRTSARAWGGIGAVALSVMLINGYVRTDGWSEGDYIVRWSGTGMARGKLKSLRDKEPASLDDYRKVLLRARRYDVAYAAERIGAIGTPAIVVPLLIEALERGEPETSEKIVDALLQLTKLDIPRGSSPAEWRARWAAAGQSGAVETE